MKTTDEQPAATEAAPEPQEEPPDSTGRVTPLRVLGVLVGAAALVAIFLFGFDYLRRPNANRLTVVAVAILVGGGGVFLLYWVMNRLVDVVSIRVRESIRPYVFVGPALVLLAVFLVYPVFNTILISFQNNNSTEFVGLDNYKFVFTDTQMLKAIRNTAGWMILVPIAAVSIGLAFATMVDRLRRGEAVAKSLIFLPMAISFAGASITWQLVYNYRPTGFGSNIGLLNGIMIGLGQDPVRWLDIQPWNNLMLMVIMVWMQTGFAMVVLSAAIKAIPDEIIEASRIDGASEMQVFWRIIVPSIVPTIVVVTTYMVINSLKIFDIVFTQPAQAENNGTVVIAERMIRWFFLFGHNGRGAAIAVILFLAVVPVMAWNIRRFREQEAIR
ncbi:MAG TPA: sugar ABC transporter permease [Actinomycetota bacterium]|nr:sugar ABC transporter permease [Actinomycetota bacterium]